VSPASRQGPGAPPTSYKGLTVGGRRPTAPTVPVWHEGPRHDDVEDRGARPEADV